MRLRKLIMPIGCLCLAAMLVIWLALESPRDGGDLRGLKTRNRMRTLAVYAETADLTPANEPTDQVITVLNLLDTGNWESFETARIETGHILDNWGNPIILKEVATDPLRVVFVSCGPNGRYENGQGDDLVIENTVE